MPALDPYATPVSVGHRPHPPDQWSFAHRRDVLCGGLRNGVVPGLEVDGLA
jgi:hypothetical protein